MFCSPNRLYLHELKVHHRAVCPCHVSSDIQTVGQRNIVLLSRVFTAWSLEGVVSSKITPCNNFKFNEPDLLSRKYPDCVHLRKKTKFSLSSVFTTVSGSCSLVNVVSK